MYKEDIRSLNQCTEKEKIKQLFISDDKEYVYALHHPHYKDSICYLQGNIPPTVLSTLLSYIQFYMTEVEEEVTLFPKDFARILTKFYGLVLPEETVFNKESVERVDIVHAVQNLEEIKDSVFFLPFYRRGLIKELLSIREELLSHFNGK